MRIHPFAFRLAVAAAFALALPASAEAQGGLLKRLKETATSTAEQEVTLQVQQLVANAVHCVFSDLQCIQGSQEAGEEVVLTDPDGEVLYNEEGYPYQDPADLPPEMVASMPGATPPAPASTFDFEAGDRILLHEDYMEDNVGDFPRHFTFLRGNWEIVEWEGRRLLQNTGPRHAAFLVELPETLPEQFTIEFDVYFPHGNQQMMVATAPPTVEGGNWTSVEGNLFKVASNQRAGLTFSPSNPGVESVVAAPAVMEGLVPFRIMVDGSHVKVFVGEERVANVPNAEIPRSRSLYFENTYFADRENPMLIGGLRVAAGGRDLYDALEADGRVAVRNILFDTGQATIKPESEEILTEIGTMLQEHADLNLMIEGHTDDQGEFDFNMTLSGDRAAAVKQYLVDQFGVDPERLRTLGLGQTQPVDTNETPEGRQQNRRVELVKI